jgi:hypothetical protein
MLLNIEIELEEVDTRLILKEHIMNRSIMFYHRHGRHNMILNRTSFEVSFQCVIGCSTIFVDQSLILNCRYSAHGNEIDCCLTGKT